ncbi:hypothetical protein HNY73_002510 [Argiope bruennichi]|uniref:Uncharacterized protein n=1 Tax=Argiope bruennichi TaxID=94029 RepID=A0A8T0FUT8_ARGBR|nr:hypothetical protein HNY73_002510 [Argiope bruennichi]
MDWRLHSWSFEMFCPQTGEQPINGLYALQSTWRTLIEFCLEVLLVKDVHPGNSSIFRNSNLVNSRGEN